MRLLRGCVITSNEFWIFWILMPDCCVRRCQAINHINRLCCIIPVRSTSLSLLISQQIVFHKNIPNFLYLQLKNKTLDRITKCPSKTEPNIKSLNSTRSCQSTKSWTTLRSRPVFQRSMLSLDLQDYTSSSSFSTLEENSLSTLQALLFRDTIHLVLCSVPARSMTLRYVLENPVEYSY